LPAGVICALLVSSLTRGQETKKKDERPVFRVGVDTVFVKASVTDPLNRYVTGLEKDHFRVFEDKVEQNIIHFTQQSAPISIAIVFDVSGSMKDNIHTARNSLVRFLQSGNPEDEYLLITFNQRTTWFRASHAKAPPSRTKSPSGTPAVVRPFTTRFTWD